MSPSDPPATLRVRYDQDGCRWAPRHGGAARCLVVLCHGIGADASQLRPLAEAWQDRLPDAAFSAPHAPFPYRRRRDQWLPWTEASGREWFSLTDRTPAAQEAGTRRAAAALDGHLDRELQRLGLGPADCALAGFSQGAMIALFAGLRRVVRPRAILCFAGELIAPDTLEGEMRNRAPVLLVHGAVDAIVPPTQTQVAASALRRCGIPVETLIIPGLGHRIDETARHCGAAFLAAVLASDGSDRCEPRCAREIGLTTARLQRG